MQYACSATRAYPCAPIHRAQSRSLRRSISTAKANKYYEHLFRILCPLFIAMTTEATCSLISHPRRGRSPVARHGPRWLVTLLSTHKVQAALAQGVVTWNLSRDAFRWFPLPLTLLPECRNITLRRILSYCGLSQLGVSSTAINNRSTRTSFEFATPQASSPHTTPRPDRRDPSICLGACRAAWAGGCCKIHARAKAELPDRIWNLPQIRLGPRSQTT